MKESRGARIGRKPNMHGYVRRRALATGELRYEARIGTCYLGSYESSAAAEAAIAAARSGGAPAPGRIPPRAGGGGGGKGAA